jgi:endonuclease/exonuclease/phosphatase family metal-dependent hydrolase
MPPVRLMTLNLRFSAEDDGPNHWFKRWPHVKALIEDLHPDVLGVQECMPNQLVALAGELGGYFTYPGPDSMTLQSAGIPVRNALFVCEPCIAPERESALALNDTGVIGQVSWDGVRPRLAHCLHFDGWTLVNTHFDTNRSGVDTVQARLESARLLVATLADLPAAVVMGDLNCPPDSPPIQACRAAGYALAKDSLPPEVDRRTYHRFTGQGIVELDYILLRGGRVLDVQIPRPRREPPYLSDHDPLVVDVEIGE